MGGRGAPPEGPQGAAPLRLGRPRQPDRRRRALRHPPAADVHRPGAGVGDLEPQGWSARRAREALRAVRARRGQALQGPRGPLLDLERAQLAHPARADQQLPQERLGQGLRRPPRRALPGALRRRPPGDQGGRPAGPGAVRRARAAAERHAEKADGVRVLAADDPARDHLLQALLEGRAPLFRPARGRVRPSPVCLQQRARPGRRAQGRRHAGHAGPAHDRARSARRPRCAADAERRADGALPDRARLHAVRPADAAREHPRRLPQAELRPGARAPAGPPAAPVPADGSAAAAGSLPDADHQPRRVADRQLRRARGLVGAQRAPARGLSVHRS